MDENSSVAKFESKAGPLLAILLFGLGIFSFTTLPDTLKGYVLDNQPGRVAPKPLHAVEVSTGTIPVGWLLITYHSEMRGDEEKSFNVAYKAQGDFWSRRRRGGPFFEDVCYSFRIGNFSQPPANDSYF